MGKMLKNTLAMAVVMLLNPLAIAAPVVNTNSHGYACSQIVPAVCATERNTASSLKHGGILGARYHYIRPGKDTCLGYAHYPLGYTIDTVPSWVVVPVVGYKTEKWAEYGWYPLIDYPGVVGGIRDYWIRYYPCQNN